MVVVVTNGHNGSAAGFMVSIRGDFVLGAGHQASPRSSPVGLPGFEGALPTAGPRVNRGIGKS